MIDDKLWDWGDDGRNQEKTNRSLFDNLSDALTAIGANFRDVRGSERLGDIRDDLRQDNLTWDEINQLKQNYYDEYANRELARQQYAQAHQNLVNDDSFLKNIDQMGGTMEGMAAQALGTAGGAVLGSVVPGAGTAAGAKFGNMAGAVAGGYLDARSVALQAEEEVLDAGGTWEQAKRAYDEALGKAVWTTLPETAIDIAMGNRLVGAALGSKAARKVAGSAAGKIGSSVLDPAAKLGTKAALKTGQGLVGRGIGLATDIAAQGATEALQEVTQDYIANREVAKALGQQDNEYSFGGFKDYALSPQGLETMKTAGIMGALFGGVGGTLSSGQYLQRGAETARGIQTQNAVEKMMKEGSLQVGEDARQKLEMIISEKKGFSPAELATWSDSEIIAEASIIEGQNYRTENKTGEKENISTIRGAVKVLNEISGNEGVVSDIGLSQQASDYLDIIGVADDMREQMFGSTTAKPTTKISLIPETAATMKGEDIKQLPHTRVPLLGRPQPNFTMGEGTAARYTGNPNFTIENQQTPGINTNNIQDITNREVIDMARQTQGDNPYSDNRQRISEEMTRRGLNLGDENREVGSYTGEPYTGQRDVSTQGTVTLNDTTADALAFKIFERYKKNPKMVGAALDNVMRHAHNPQEVAFARNVAQRVLGRMNGYYGGQTQFDNGVAYGGYTEPQQEVRGEPVPAEGQKVKRRYKKRQPVMPVEQVLGTNLTTPTENGTVEQIIMEGGQTNGQTENTRGTEDLRGTNQQQVSDGSGVRQESLQGRNDQENVAGREEGTGNSQERVLSKQGEEQQEESFGKQILGRIPKALKDAWAGLKCNSKIEDWRVVSGKGEYLKLFSEALSKAIKNNKTHGVYVDSMSVDELEGATVILHKSKKAGLVIDKNGTLHGVFKDPSLKIPYIIHDITLIAREMGCVRMDCFGGFLVRNYQTLGFIPVAKLNFVEGFYPAENPANATIRKEEPSVYVLVRNNDSNAVARNKIANGGYEYMSDGELDNLLTFNSYGGAIYFGDAIPVFEKKFGKDFDKGSAAFGVDDAFTLFEECNLPKQTINDLIKSYKNKLKSLKNIDQYSFYVGAIKTLTDQLETTDESQKLSQQQVDRIVDENLGKVKGDSLTKGEYSYIKDVTDWGERMAKRDNKTDKALAEQQAQQKNNQQQQQTKETKQQKPETVQEYLERRDNEIEEEVEREEQAATVDKNKNTTETKNANKPMTKQESRAYIRKKAQESGMLKFAQKETTQQKPVVQKEKTESDSVVSGWIERLTNTEDFNFEDAYATLQELLDKGNITENEYDKIMNGLMDYVENQESKEESVTEKPETAKVTAETPQKSSAVETKEETRKEDRWKKYRDEDGYIDNEKEGVFKGKDDKIDEPLFDKNKDEDENPTDGQDYIYTLVGNYEVSNKILANLKARIKKEMNSKNPRGDMDFFNDAYEEISSEQESRAENDERISADENTCPWTSEMIFDNMLEQAQFIESQNEENTEEQEQTANETNIETKKIIGKAKEIANKIINKAKSTLTREEKNGIEKTLTETLDFGKGEGEIVRVASEENDSHRQNLRGNTQENKRPNKIPRKSKSIGFSLVRSLINNSFENLTGKKVNSIQELAEIAQVLRHPGYEKFHTVYIKNGQIISHETITTMSPYHSSVISKDEKDVLTHYTRVRDKTKQLQADTVYILHNHPSGDIKPSQADILATNSHRYWIERGGAQFGGHIILDTTQYTSISEVNGKWNVLQGNIPQNAIINYNKKLSKNDEPLGIRVSSPDDMYNISKKLADQSTTTAFFLDSQMEIRGIVQLPKEFSNLKLNAQRRYLRLLARNNYSAYTFISTGDSQTYNSLKPLYNEKSGLLDIILTSDRQSEWSKQNDNGILRNYTYNDFFGIKNNGTLATKVLSPQEKIQEKTKTLTDKQIEAMDKREEKEYQKRQERIENADNAGELSDKLKDVYSVTFTKSAQESAENRTRMEYFDNREKYWNREEKDGNVTYTRKTPFDHHQKEMTYDGANGYTKEDRKKSKPAEWVEWLKDRIIKYAFNDMHFLAKAARKLGVYDAYVEMAVTKGYALKANTAMQKGIKYNGKYTRALNDIIKDIGEEKQKGFIEYCIAKRILDLSNTELRDMPQYQDMKPDEAKKIIEKYENGADAKLFMKNQKDFVEYNHALLHVLVDGGIISQEEFDALVKRDPNFVPLAKIMDDPDFGFGSIQAARSIVNVKTPIKRIGTSFRKIKNPFLEMQKRTAEYYAIASRNKAGQIFVNKIAGALDKKANGDMVEKGQGMIRKVEVDEVTGEKITKPDDKQQIIYISNNGKQEFYQVSDSEIYHALKALDADQMGTIQKMIDPFLHAPSALIRETATMVPDFGVRNLIRDGGEAFLTSEHGFLPLIDQIWGMYQMANNTEWYQHFLEQQGEYGTRTRESANQDNFAKIEDTIDEKVNVWKNFQEIRRANWNTLTNKKKSKTQRAVALLTLMGSIPYAFVKSNKRINEYLEMGTRVGEFKNAKMGYNGTLDRLSKGGILDWGADIKNAKGMSDVLAAGKSKEITLNFQQHGIVGKQLNRYIPFFNATLQGIYKLCNALELMATGRTLSGEKNRTLQGEILFKAALVTAIGIGVAAAGEGDDDYEQANQYEKENFWILPNGLRFPKDQVLGKLFGNVAEKSYTQWRKGKFEPSDILRSILENFTPDKFMPALAEIALGGIYNYDTFYKSAIVPEYMEGKLGHLQKDLATSNMAVDISNALWKYFHADVSAKRLDWALQKNFTNVKKYVDSLYDLGFSDNEKMARGYDKSDATGEFVGALKDNKIPIINKVTGTFATNRTNYKSISDFYSKYNELKRLATDEPSMSKEEKRQWKRYEQAYKKDKNFRKQLRAIKQDKSLTGAQKREKADKIFKQQIKLAKWAEG